MSLIITAIYDRYASNSGTQLSEPAISATDPKANSSRFQNPSSISQVLALTRQAAWLKAVELGGELAYSYLGNDQLIAGNDELGADYYSAYFQSIGADPEAVRSLIQNARDPDTGKAFLDNWIAEAVANASTTEETIAPYFWYLYFGYLDDYFAAVNNLRGKGTGWTNADLLQFDGMIFRRIGYTRHPVYLEIAKSDGMFDLWDQRSAPDHCQKVDGDWVCE